MDGKESRRGMDHANLYIHREGREEYRNGVIGKKREMEALGEKMVTA